MSYLPVNYPSLCIPRVFPGISQKFIEDMFRQIGILSHVEMNLRTSAKGEKYYLVFIHFQMWYLDTYTYDTRLRLVNGENIPVFYNEKQFWKVSAMRLAKPTNPPPPRLSAYSKPPLPNPPPPPPKSVYSKPPLPISPPPIKALRIELPSDCSLSLDKPRFPCSPHPKTKTYSPISPLTPPPSSPTSSYSSISYKQYDPEEEEPLTYENCGIDYRNTQYPARRRPARYQKAF